MHRGDIFHRGNPAGADGPDRLVGHGQPCRDPFTLRQRTVELGGDDGFRLARIALRLGLSDAEDDAQASGLRSLGFGADSGIALAMHRPAFGMADNDEIGPGIEQDRCGDIAGEGAAGLGVAVLPAHADRFHCLAHRRDERERRRQRHLHARKPARCPVDRAGFGQHGARAVHLPVADDIGNPRQDHFLVA